MVIWDLNKLESSSTPVRAGWILSSDSAGGAEGTAFNPEVSQNAFKIGTSPITL